MGGRWAMADISTGGGSPLCLKTLLLEFQSKIRTFSTIFLKVKG